MNSYRRLSIRAQCLRSDRGFTLVEGIMAMTVFLTVMAILASAIAAMTSSVRQSTGVSIATEQNRRTFERLDKQVRYADGVRQEAADGSILLRLPQQDDAAGKPQHECQQWRLVAGRAGVQRLQARSWLVTETAPPTVGAASPWSNVATGLVNGPATPPLTVIATGGSHDQQGLIVDLQMQRNSKPLGRAHLKATFFARNTDLSTPTTGFCAPPP